MEKITLKDDRVFVVCNEIGDMLPNNEGFGMYLNDMRFLSVWKLDINDQKPMLLSHITEYNYAAVFQLSNQFFQFSSESLKEDTGDENEPAFNLSNLLPNATPNTTHNIAAHTVGVTRRRIIKNGLHDTLEFNNFYEQPLQIEVSLTVASDLKDIFEIRGFPRDEQAGHTAPELAKDKRSILFKATGLDNITRSLRVSFSRSAVRMETEKIIASPNNSQIPSCRVYFLVNLPPFTTVSLKMDAVPQSPDNSLEQLAEPVLEFTHEVENARQKFANWQHECTKLQTNEFVLNQLLRTSTLDLRSLMQQWPQGLAVTAGIPWYFTLFGRDSLITAMQSLVLNPAIARDTLRVLATFQGTKMDDWHDEEPGKILHELRQGEMVRTGELPHNPYYGTVDATPLFVWLFAETVKWTGDTNLYAELWPNIERALEWINTYGDPDKDGYLEYYRRSERGILHQGWKDSDESIGGQLGPRPEPPLALVEVQGYAYAAKNTLADVVELYGNNPKLVTKLRTEAQKLKTQFNRDFWWPEEGFLAQGLDGKKQQIRHVSSNPGHCLWTGIVDEDKARQVALRLVQPDMLNGWGVRTLSSNDNTYNPMSYHNGSIWPHDNSVIVAGLKRYGFDDLANLVASQILEAGLTFPAYRLPELYCGFDTNPNARNAPSAYPVSCSPQAWAAATPFLLIQSMVGLKVNGGAKFIEVSPHLPDWLNQLRLSNLRVGDARLDLLFERNSETGQTAMQIRKNPNDVTVLLHTPNVKTVRTEELSNLVGTDIGTRLRGED